MVRDKAVSQADREKIRVFRDDDHLSLEQINSKTRIPLRTIQNLISSGNYSQSSQKRGPKLKISRKGETRIKRYFRNHRKSGHRKVPDLLELDVSHSTMLRTMKRIKFSIEQLTEENSQKVPIVFTDEKKFRYDGPDGYNFYWQLAEDKKNNEMFSKDYNMYNGVMVHLAISDAGILSCDRITGK
ncbi:MAG: hypothetical protein EZS28_002754, partial [Streblomastix strix]